MKLNVKMPLRMHHELLGKKSENSVCGGFQEKCSMPASEGTKDEGKGGWLPHIP
jgi:hypothetical protein